MVTDEQRRQVVRWRDRLVGDFMVSVLLSASAMTQATLARDTNAVTSTIVIVRAAKPRSSFDRSLPMPILAKSREFIEGITQNINFSKGDVESKL